MPTIKDVAELSGVCVTTVSRVLNKRGYISKETYDKVYDAMDKLDYQPNQLARNMFRQRTNFIGLLIPDISHPFFAEMAHHIEILLFNRGYKMILCNTQKNDAREQDYLNMLRQNKVDGAIVGTHMLETSDYKKLSLPIIGLDVFLGDSIPTVCANHILGGKLAAKPFIDGSARCVLQIKGNHDIKSPVWMRNSVFASELGEHNIRCIDYELKENEFYREQYYDLIDDMLKQYPEIDGIFSTDAVVAYGIKYVLEHKKRIPDDIMIVGYDGVEASKTSYPALSYVEQPFEALSETIVDVLLRKIDGESITNNITVDGIRYVEGNTTR
ncbi:MAG: LacI family DNA-binding transcriptional regulator [Lachnospiraceae bacterium]|nr:LacI family DNA-binding transcriptional regulator [Lachnospiraceae bacterium]